MPAPATARLRQVRMAGGRAGGHNSPMIYIVDDDEAVRMSLSLLLLSFGWRSRTFGSADEVLEAFPQSMPKCLLLDLNMPGTNGVELQSILAARHCAVPTVIITAEPHSPMASAALAAGAMTVLGKPFQQDQLKLAIDDALAITRH